MIGQKPEKDGFERWCDDTFGEAAGCAPIIFILGVMLVIGLVGAFFGGCQGGGGGNGTRVIQFHP